MSFTPGHMPWSTPPLQQFIEALEDKFRGDPVRVTDLTSLFSQFDSRAGYVGLYLCPLCLYNCLCVCVCVCVCAWVQLRVRVCVLVRNSMTADRMGLVVDA